MIVTIGGLESRVGASLSKARIAWRSQLINDSTFRVFSFFLTSTLNSPAINAAVSKSNDAVTHFIILFSNNFFMTSCKGTHIFSENSLTVMFGLMVISCFLTKFSEAAAALWILGAAGLAG